MTTDLADLHRRAEDGTCFACAVEWPCDAAVAVARVTVLETELRRIAELPDQPQAAAIANEALGIAVVASR